MERSYEAYTSRDLLKRYERLEQAMQTCESTEDYLGCMARLDAMGQELQRRGVDLPNA